MTPFRIAVVGHFFYEEQAGMIAGYLKNIPREFDLYASAPAASVKKVRSVLSEAFPGKKIFLKGVLNRGFDIAPFLCEFGEIYSGYDLVLKVHTKKSPHRLWLKEWGRYLLENLAGSAGTVAAILRMFEENERLGMVYPEVIPILGGGLEKESWSNNWKICSVLAGRLGLELPATKAVVFPAGSMFWFRPRALAPLYELGLGMEDFPCEVSIRRNGTLAHAIERLLSRVVEKSGFVARPVCFEPFQEGPDRSFWQRVRDKIHAEKYRVRDFLGMQG
ncbi:MAG TPA: rhamnan synthesis F family protein [Candidatus Omnitrophota bacterium]|nr:rhamnan synthesis F family protein [Candidatus Omnitrophota bacterium]HPS36294.1 rhamnan synthesis F family protein [Candidatus Omnitrophota bacterium]